MPCTPSSCAPCGSPGPCPCLDAADRPAVARRRAGHPRLLSLGPPGKPAPHELRRDDQRAGRTRPRARARAARWRARRPRARRRPPARRPDPRAGARCRSACWRAGADERDGDDRQQRGRLGLDLGQAEQEHERGHEQDRRRRPRAARRRCRRRTPIATAATTSIRSASADRRRDEEARRKQEIQLGRHALLEPRARRPRRRPPGRPTSTPLAARRRCRRPPGRPPPPPAMTTIAASDVPVASRSS